MVRDWDEDEHPRHLAGAPDSRGGQFRRFAAPGIHRIMANTTPGWVDRVSRRLAGQRYTPGAWVQESVADYRFALENELSQDLPRDLIDELFADYDWPTAIYRNGDHVVTIQNRFLAQGRAKEILAHIDELQTRFPVQQKLRIAVVPDWVIDGDRGGAFPQTGIAYLSEEAFDDWAERQGDTYTMPAGRPGPDRAEQWRYALTHEWGHLLDPSWSRDATDPLYQQAVHMSEIAEQHLSDYGNSNPTEAIAEAFAEFYLSRGQTKNPAAIAYATWLHWRWEQ